MISGENDYMSRWIEQGESPRRRRPKHWTYSAHDADVYVAMQQKKRMMIL
jgi:hypothetical protein